MKIKFIVIMVALSYFMIPRAAAQSCTGCSTILTPGGSGDLNIQPGETYCLSSGTYNQNTAWHNFNIASTGTLCISSGATYSVGWTSNVQGTIINHGTLKIEGISSTWNVHIKNYGTLTVNGSVSGNISGLIENYGTLTLAGNVSANIENRGRFNSSGMQGYSGLFTNDSIVMVSGSLTFIDGSKINNTGKFNINGNFKYNGSTYSNGITLTNSDSFVVSGGQIRFVGSLNNIHGVVVFNGNQSSLTGSMDNSGFVFLKNMTSGNGISGALAGDGLCATVNNYGSIKVESGLSVGSITYLTNDSSITISNVSGDINFNGELFTNNGRFSVTTGNLKINSTETEFANNGIIIVSGTFSMNQSGSDTAKLRNACRIVASNIILNTGIKLENNGLLWATTGEVKIDGNPNKTILKNGKTGFVRGVNFRNSGAVTGFGKFYFTGHTDFNSAGKFVGNSASDPIQFFDVTQTNPPNIFDAESMAPIHTIRPLSMAPLDTASFDCASIPPVVAGTPPYVKNDTLVLCDAAPVTLHLITDSLIRPYDNTYSIYWPSLKLFSVGGSENTTSLTVPQGIFTTNTTNQTIVFTPNGSFTSGTVKAQFRVANRKPGDPVTYTSPRATIIIKVIPVSAPENLDVNGY